MEIKRFGNIEGKTMMLLHGNLMCWQQFEDLIPLLELSAVSALVALVPFVYIWKVLRDVLAAAPNFAQAVNIPHYGWMAVLFAVLSYLI